MMDQISDYHEERSLQLIFTYLSGMGAVQFILLDQLFLFETFLAEERAV